MIIRSFEISKDYTAVAQIVAGYLSPQFYWPQASLETEVNVSKGVVLEENGGLRAFLFFREMNSTTYEIQLLATAPEYARRGYMRVLLNNWLNSAAQHKEVWLEVHADNKAAMATYERSGFEVVGRRMGYYRDRGDAILFSRKALRE